MRHKLLSNVKFVCQIFSFIETEKSFLVTIHYTSFRALCASNRMVRYDGNIFNTENFGSSNRKHLLNNALISKNKLHALTETQLTEYLCLSKFFSVYVYTRHWGIGFQIHFPSFRRFSLSRATAAAAESKCSELGVPPSKHMPLLGKCVCYSISP